jgi:hypothetical protein
VVRCAAARSGGAHAEPPYSLTEFFDYRYFAAVGTNGTRSPVSEA